MLLSNVRQRLARNEGGFTLIELLVVLIIIAVLLAIAVPSYLTFKERAEQRAAGANVRAAIPAAEALYSDENSYATISVLVLEDIDAGLKVTDAKPVTVDGVAGAGYCIQSTHNGETDGKAVHSFTGPGGNVDDVACAA
jgi:type IV pilus assembly protein PilA